jgi:hypothetical protein
MSACVETLIIDDDGALAIIPARAGVEGHIIVEAYVDGQGPYDFALDTGASISVIFERPGREIAARSMGDKTVHVLSMTGVGNFPVTTVGQITVGSETWQDARVALLPETAPLASRVDGILGIDFLSRYAVWHSHQDNSVRLYPKELVAERSYLGWESIPLYDMRIPAGEVTVLAFDVYIDAHRIPTVFDLGASVNLMNLRAARELRIAIRHQRDLPDVWGVSGTTPVLTELHVTWLQVSRMTWRGRRFLIGDFRVFEALEYNSRPLAIAGMGFFDDHDLIIDFEKKRLLVKRTR